MTIGKKVKYLLLSVLLIVGQGFALAATFQTDQLAALFKTKTRSRADFIQKRYFQFSKRPVISSGYLYFQAPDYLAQVILKPQPQTLIATGGYLTVMRNNRIISKSALNRAPNLMILTTLLRQILKGDMSQLQQYFRLTLSGTRQNWQLMLMPKRTGFGNISRVQLNGHRGNIDVIAVHYSTGDLLTLTLTGYP